MKVVLVENFLREEIQVQSLKADELSCALQCKHITFDHTRFQIMGSEMIVPKYSPIADSTPYVILFVIVVNEL